MPTVTHVQAPGKNEPVSSCCYERNLAALARRQPEVAAQVSAARVPAGVEWVTGRDGTPTARLPGSDGKAVWLGRSSMPTVSAEALAGRFRLEPGSATLPGVLTGAEAAILLHYLPPPCALFIAEPDPLLIKLALHLHDLADGIEAGRIVLLTGADLEAAFVSFFQAHPGYEFPEKLVPVPQRPTAELAHLQHQLEITGAAVVRYQHHAVETLAAALRGQPRRRPLPDAPRVVVVSTDARSRSAAQARRIERALAAVHWPAVVCLPDRPEHAHVWARLKAIMDAQADLVLLVNSMPGALRELLPPDLPLATWYGAGADPVARGPQEWRAVDTAWAGSIRQRDLLAAAGVPAECIELLDVAAEGAGDVGGGAEVRPVGVPAGAEEAAAGVVVLADLPSVGPEAAGVTLPTQRMLYQALQQVVAEAGEACFDANIGDLLHRAEKTSGFPVPEAQTRAQFERLLGERILPAACARQAVEGLARLDVVVELWGTNWDKLDLPRVAWRGPVPTGAGLQRVFDRARLVVLPWASEEAVETALDAVYAGVPVVCRAPQAALASLYPGPAELADHLHLYRNARDLVGQVRRLLASDASRQARLDAARRLVTERHTLRQRLGTLRDGVRRRQQGECRMQK